MAVAEFVELPEIEGEKKELIRGELADVPLGDEPVHEHTKANLIAILVAWLHESRDGQVFAGSPYILDDYNCLATDIGVLTGERLKRGIDDLFRGAPHLAVKVVSRETARRLRPKVGLYLKNGSKAVWAVYPKSDWSMFTARSTKSRFSGKTRSWKDTMP
jgi:hypothetical protein